MHSSSQIRYFMRSYLLSAKAGVSISKSEAILLDRCQNNVIIRTKSHLIVKATQTKSISELELRRCEYIMFKGSTFDSSRSYRRIEKSKAIVGYR